MLFLPWSRVIANDPKNETEKRGSQGVLQTECHCAIVSNKKFIPEFEFDDQVSEEEGSVYKEGAGPAEDDEEEDDFTVTDDEDEQEEITMTFKKQKNIFSTRVTITG